MPGLPIFNEVFLDEVRLPAANLVGDVNRGWGLAKVTLGNERVSLSSGGALWGMGPAADELFDVVRAAGGVTNPVMRQRLADLHIKAELLRPIRLRPVTARLTGAPPGAEASTPQTLPAHHAHRRLRLYTDPPAP